MRATSDATAVAVIAALAIAVPPALGDLTAEVSQLIADKVTGGVSGFHLEKINGPVLASQNAGYLFYPASSIKVLQHVHAMLEVEKPGGVDLGTVIPVYDDPAESCDDDHAGDTPTPRALEVALRRMMEDSDNQDTNAVQELFGRPAINATAHAVIGMSAATQLNHKLGCAGPDSDPVNQMPLWDATLLHERVALGQVFALESTRETFYDLMLDGNWLEDLMDEEAPAEMTADDLAAFKADVRMARKGGSYGDPDRYLSMVGWISLPWHPCFASLPPREYVFGVFFNDFDAISPTFGAGAAVEAMLRGEVRAALEDWQACESCGAAGAGPCDQAHGDPGCEDGDCCQAVCAVDPLCCDPDFGWGAACVSYAIGLCDLSPGHDACEDPLEISNCWLSCFDISSAVPDGPTHLDECEWFSPFIKDLWFVYEATSTGIFTVGVCSDDEAGDPSDPFNLWLGAYAVDGCGPDLAGTLIDCTFGTVACGQGHVLLDVPVVQGQRYRIRVGAGNPSYGTGAIETFCVEPGDNAGDPLDLGAFVGTTPVSTTDASTDGPPHAVCLGGDDPQIHNDVWFTWTAPCDGTLAVDTCGAADFDTRLAVYGGCTAPPGDASLLGCDDDVPGCAGYGSRLEVPVSAGACYLIRVGGYNSARGTGAMTIACSGPCTGDINGDGSVGITDLLLLLAAWGPHSTPHPADLDGDFIVGIVDLLLLLGNWGPCASG